MKTQFHLKGEVFQTNPQIASQASLLLRVARSDSSSKSIVILRTQGLWLSFMCK